MGRTGSGRSVGSRLASIPRRIWRVIGDVAETLSELGHGRRPWIDDREFENPYAGAGPGSPGRVGRGQIPDS